MKKLIFFLVIITIQACSDNTVQPSMSNISNSNNLNSELETNVPQSLKMSQSRLNCAQFNLDSIDNMVCTYWKDSRKFKANINIQDYETYSSLIEVNELSPVEYNFFATTKINYKSKSYQAKIFPNSRVQLLDGNKVLNLICSKESCSEPFLWGFATESTIKANPMLADVMMNKLSYIYITTTIKNTSEIKTVR